MESDSSQQSPLLAAANAMVRLHKEQFGRGPTKARAEFAGPDMLICALFDALLPAERKLVELGKQDEVRQGRILLQSATEREFTEAMEEILDRKVAAFGSSVDPDANVVFEIYRFEPRSSDSGGNAY